MAENNQKDIPTEQTGHFHRCASALHKTRLKFSPWRPPQAVPVAVGTVAPAPQLQTLPASALLSAPSWGWLPNCSSADMGSVDTLPAHGPMAQPSFSLSPRRSLCLSHCPVVPPQNHSCWGGVQCHAVQSLFLLQISVATPANCFKSSSSALQIFLIFFFFPQLPFKSVATLEMQRE